MMILRVALFMAAAAIVSAFPELHQHRVLIGLGFILLVTLLNLRGIRESGLFFSIPTYVYVASMFSLLAFGLFRFATGTMPVYVPPAAWDASQVIEPLGLLLILRISSVSGILAAASAPVTAAVFNEQTMFPMLLGFALLVIWQHRENIRRLVRGEEPRVGKKD